MSTDSERFAVALDRLVAFLIASDEAEWAHAMTRTAVLVRRGDPQGVDNYLHSLGGMGSFSDLMLYPRPGDDELRALSDEAFEAAMALRVSGDY